MSEKHPPQPERFDVFTELPNGSGFTIRGSKHVFKFDRHGGWYDEYRNYYDKNATPTDPPSDDDRSDGAYSHSDHSDGDYDEFEKEYGKPKQYVEDYDEPNLIHLERIAYNLENLANYPNKALRVNFKNVGYYSKREEVLVYFQKKVKGVVNVVFNKNERGQFNGTGYFVADNPKSAEELIKLEGEKYGDRDIKFDLEDIESFLIDPLRPEELSLNPPENKGGIKKFYNSSLNQEKKEVFVPEVKKQDPKKEEAKKEEAKKIEAKTEAPVIATSAIQSTGDIFVSYKFERSNFPTKTSFKDWINGNKFDNEKDVKIVEKIQGNDAFAKVTMKKKVFDKLNNTVHNGGKIVFTPL